MKRVPKFAQKVNSQPEKDTLTVYPLREVISSLYLSDDSTPCSKEIIKQLETV